jgi:hypothetical protein
MTHGTGYAAVLFNLDQTKSVALTVSLAALGSGSAKTIRYDKAIYDESQNGVWAGPVASRTASWTGTVPVTLTPWSMTVLTISP